MIGKKKSKSREILNKPGADKEIYNWQRTMKRASFKTNGPKPKGTTGKRKNYSKLEQKNNRSAFVRKWLEKNIPELIKKEKP